jgi:hypothetical protein
MRFVETPVFTRVMTRLIDDDSYRALNSSGCFFGRRRGQ